jgi:hypothetical protein
MAAIDPLWPHEKLESDRRDWCRGGSRPRIASKAKLHKRVRAAIEEDRDIVATIVAHTTIALSKIEIRFRLICTNGSKKYLLQGSLHI